MPPEFMTFGVLKKIDVLYEKGLMGFPAAAAGLIWPQGSLPARQNVPKALAQTVLLPVHLTIEFDCVGICCCGGGRQRRPETPNPRPAVIIAVKPFI